MLGRKIKYKQQENVRFQGHEKQEETPAVAAVAAAGVR